MLRWQTFKISYDYFIVFSHIVSIQMAIDT
jgi:hypothetical protein